MTITFCKLFALKRENAGHKMKNLSRFLVKESHMTRNLQLILMGWMAATLACSSAEAMNANALDQLNSPASTAKVSAPIEFQALSQPQATHHYYQTQPLELPLIFTLPGVFHPSNNAGRKENIQESYQQSSPAIWNTINPSRDGASLPGN